MIHPRQQWCVQIDVTNSCPRKCSNCTRMLSHVAEPFYMSVGLFREAARAGADFLAHSEADLLGRHKVVGVIGGEPLRHPEFAQLCQVMQELVPDKSSRGLWTSLPWRTTKYAQLISNTFGYFNENRHNTRCEHQPILVAIKDVIKDPDHMWELIDNCWLQREWVGAITPKGYFFCEVAAAMDWVFGGPGGKPIKPGCWAPDIADFREQVERWCPRCGICLPLKGRQDCEEIDDITRSNYDILLAQGSPRLLGGQYCMYDPSQYDEAANKQGWLPKRYLKGPR